jgi:hypothetical protein
LTPIQTLKYKNHTNVRPKSSYKTNGLLIRNTAQQWFTDMHINTYPQWLEKINQEMKKIRRIC